MAFGVSPLIVLNNGYLASPVGGRMCANGGDCARVRSGPVGARNKREFEQAPSLKIKD